MLFTIYGNCQADVLSNLLQQSPEFDALYKLARLRPCFAVPLEDVETWARDQAPEVRLLVTQKLRKGWRAQTEQFDPDWLRGRAAEGAEWLEWTDMYYKAYEPHMAYPLSFPRRPPVDYINILHVLTYANGRPWRDLIPFYEDPALFPAALLEGMHRAAQEELARREEDCSLGIARFMADNWRQKRQFLTFNHPGRDVVRHVANQVIDRLGLATPVPETGYFGFPASSGLPLLAACNQLLDTPDIRDPAVSFSIDHKVIPMADYFDRWQASFDQLGQEALRRELRAQAHHDPVMARPVLDIAARHLGLPVDF